MYEKIAETTRDTLSLRYPCAAFYRKKGAVLVVICTWAARRALPDKVRGPKALEEIAGVSLVQGFVCGSTPLSNTLATAYLNETMKQAARRRA
jgi:hypothetical protein